MSLNRRMNSCLRAQLVVLATPPLYQQVVLLPSRWLKSRLGLGRLQAQKLPQKLALLAGELH